MRQTDLALESAPFSMEAEKKWLCSECWTEMFGDCSSCLAPSESAKKLQGSFCC